MTQLIAHKGKVYQKIELPGWFESYAEVPAVEAKPGLTWTGPPIPTTMIRQMLSFFKWTCDTHKCESQVRFFMNESERRWKMWAFPQEKIPGLSTKEIQCEAVEIQQRALGLNGYVEYGTAHHHCYTSAFQSGIDLSDERQRPGIHITIGNMNSDRYSVHARACVMHEGKLHQHDVRLSDWIELPEAFQSLSNRAKAVIAEDIITTPCNDQFPEVWKTNIMDRPVDRMIQVGGYFPPVTHHRSMLDGRDFVRQALEAAEENGYTPDELMDALPLIQDVSQLWQGFPGTWKDAVDAIEKWMLRQPQPTDVESEIQLDHKLAAHQQWLTENGMVDYNS